LNLSKVEINILGILFGFCSFYTENDKNTIFKKIDAFLKKKDISILPSLRQTLSVTLLLRLSVLSAETFQYAAIPVSLLSSLIKKYHI
jgi:hypothetical protein